MSRSQRTKGQGGERELAAILSAEIGQVVKRTLGQARDGGFDIETPPFVWEVKRRKKMAVYEFVEQVEAACRPGDRGIVAMRADGKQWLALMTLDVALELVRGNLNKPEVQR